MNKMAISWISSIHRFRASWLTFSTASQRYQTNSHRLMTTLAMLWLSVERNEYDALLWTFMTCSIAPTTFLLPYVSSPLRTTTPSIFRIRTITLLDTALLEATFTDGTAVNGHVF